MTGAWDDRRMPSKVPSLKGDIPEEVQQREVACVPNLLVALSHLMVRSSGGATRQLLVCVRKCGGGNGGSGVGRAGAKMEGTANNGVERGEDHKKAGNYVQQGCWVAHAALT